MPAPPQRRMPAEWERQSAVLLSFPRAAGDWGSLAQEVADQHLALVLSIAQYTPVTLIVADAELLELSRQRSGRGDLSPLGTLLQPNSRQSEETDTSFVGSRRGKASLVAQDELPQAWWKPQQSHPIRLCFLAANDVWARDFGPISIEENGQRKLLNFTFNGWGNKFDASLDNTLTERLHLAGVFGELVLESIPLVFEGGSIESDGQGTLLSTTQCLLSPERNPHLSQAEISAQLLDALGAHRILYLDHGHLEGDDTDAHIDTLARFASEDTIVYQACDDPEDSHYAAFQAMEAQLRSFRRSNGWPYRLLALPWHPPTYSREDGRRLPGTYANFLITNGAVLLPTAGHPRDAEALAVLEQAFPDRRILPTPAHYFVEQHGSVHCLTMQW